MIDNYTDLTKNDCFSKLRGLDLQELMLDVDKLPFVYRDTLLLLDNATVGMEIEYENVKKACVDDFFAQNKFEGWESESDSSLTSGGEIKSPILIDEKDTWNELQAICRFLRKKGAVTDRNAGGHIHVGSHVLKSYHDWRKFLKAYMVYEHILFRFGYGDKLTGRKKIMEYAYPIADKLYENLDKFNSVRNEHDMCFLFPTHKYQALNFQDIDVNFMVSDEIYNTLEFRHPNATDQEVIWQNNSNAFSKLLLSSSSDHFDEEFLDYKLKNERVSSSDDLYMYHEVCLKNALEFVDLIFDNNLDKKYFLKQYLKNFHSLYKANTAIKAKRFIR